MIQYQSLKQAFQQARTENNIDILLPALLSAKLHVVGKRLPTASSPVFFVQQSPNEERFCITASETEGRLSSIEGVSLIRISGEELLRTMNPEHEILFIYEDGGDYLTLEQLSWFRDSIARRA